ncbi:ER membrane protein complex subunit 4 [Paramecium bursaria]
MQTMEIKIRKERIKENPVGYKRDFNDCQGQELKDDLERKASSIAKGGLGQIFMFAFTLYMTGSAINLFSIVIIGQMLSQSIQYLTKVHSAFSSLDNKGIPLFTYKLIYQAIGLLQLGVVGYKLYNIGLLPFNSADWIDLVPYHSQREYVVPYNYN